MRLETENLSFSYSGKSVLQDVSISVDSGSFTVLLGPNGSGKSTLALILAGLMKESGGTVSLTQAERRSLCRIVFQNPDNQIIGESVEEDTAFGPENLNLPPDEIRMRVDEALSACSLIDRKKDSPRSLSGGERQRLALASVLALRPEFLILDEASSMLDRRSISDILSIIRRECRERGLGVLYITHHTEEVVEADRVYILADGRITSSGTPQEVLTYDNLTSSSLSLPYALSLSHSLGLEECLTLEALASAVVRKAKR